MTRLFFGAALFATLTVNANAAFNPPGSTNAPKCTRDGKKRMFN